MATDLPTEHDPPPETRKECRSRIHTIASRNKKRIVILLIVMIAALLVGTLGYKTLAGMNNSEAFLNASMILSGMGPMDSLQDKTAAKIFASFFAIFSGAFFLILFAYLLQGILLSSMERERLELECPED